MWCRCRKHRVVAAGRANERAAGVRYGWLRGCSFRVLVPLKETLCNTPPIDASRLCGTTETPLRPLIGSVDMLRESAPAVAWLHKDAA